MKAKEYLQRIRKVDTIIQNKLIEKERWFALATSTTTSSSGERVQASGSQQKMADSVLRYIEVERQIDECIDLLIDAKQDVVSTIETLPTIEYDLLHKVYIQFRSLGEVAAAQGKTYSWATTVHGRALKHVQDILDKRYLRQLQGETDYTHS